MCTLQYFYVIYSSFKNVRPNFKKNENMLIKFMQIEAKIYICEKLYYIFLKASQ